MEDACLAFSPLSIKNLATFVIDRMISSFSSGPGIIGRGPVPSHTGSWTEELLWSNMYANGLVEMSSLSAACTEVGYSMLGSEPKTRWWRTIYAASYKPSDIVTIEFCRYGLH